MFIRDDRLVLPFVKTVQTDYGKPPIVRVSTDKLTTLFEMLGDYTFFTPALLHTHGAWSSKKWTELSPLAGRDITVMYAVLPEPIFSGIPNPNESRVDWNKSIFFVKHADWHAVCEFVIGTTAYANGNFAAGYGVQDIFVKDVLSARKARPMAKIPLIPVNGFGVRTPRWTLAFSGTPPKPIRLPGAEDIEIIAKATADGDNPLVVVSKKQMIAKYERAIAEARNNQKTS